MKCLDCRRIYALAEFYVCPECGGELKLQYDHDSVRRRGEFARQWRGNGSIFTRFSELLPLLCPASAVSMGEGGTPLIRARNLSRRLGLRDLFLKLECCNPSGSFKDRQVSVGVSVARQFGRKTLAAISSGNVGNALAAYAARSGMRAYVWVASCTEESKRLQIRMYAPRLFEIETSLESDAYDNAYEAAVRSFPAYCIQHGLAPMTSARSVNPFMVEGGKTIAYEVCAELGRCPDVISAPVGGGGLVGGLSEGFRDLREIGLINRVPRILAGQRSDYFAAIDRVDDPEGRGARPLDAKWAASAVRNSDGALHRLSREQVSAAQAELAEREGIFAEPRGAYAHAAIAAETRTGRLDRSSVVVAIVSGTGLKDMGAAASLQAQHRKRSPQRVSCLWDSDLDAFSIDARLSGNEDLGDGIDGRG